MNTEESIYVKLTTVGDFPCLPEEMKTVEKALEALGLQNFCSKDDNVRFNVKYYVVNWKKNAFTNSQTTYDVHDYIPVNEFLESLRGQLGTKPFGI